jgi:hypothetical protein
MSMAGLFPIIRRARFPYVEPSAPVAPVVVTAAVVLPPAADVNEVAVPAPPVVEALGAAKGESNEQASGEDRARPGRKARRR